MPEMSDFGVVLPISMIAWFAENSYKYMLKGFFLKHVKDQNDSVVAEARAEKCAINIYKFCYFLFSSYFGYQVLSDQYYFPRSMGGNGTFDKLWQDYPYQKRHDQEIIYIQLILSYHVAQFFKHFVHSKKNDFNEMLLHHSVTVLLCVFSYLQNCTPIAMCIMFLHDFSDITSGLVKCLAETRYSTAAALTFVYHCIVWFYLRCMVFPSLIWNGII